MRPLLSKNWGFDSLVERCFNLPGQSQSGARATGNATSGTNPSVVCPSARHIRSTRQKCSKYRHYSNLLTKLVLGATNNFAPRHVPWKTPRYSVESQCNLDAPRFVLWISYNCTGLNNAFNVSTCHVCCAVRVCRLFHLDTVFIACILYALPAWCVLLFACQLEHIDAFWGGHIKCCFY